MPISERLGRLKATAIGGNDLTASCLYTAGVCIQVVCGMCIPFAPTLPPPARKRRLWLVLVPRDSRVCVCGWWGGGGLRVHGTAAGCWLLAGHGTTGGAVRVGVPPHRQLPVVRLSIHPGGGVVGLP
jgi:hypothetical protein